jgi:predicted dinucleotide-utilizing enzyme
VEKESSEHTADNPVWLDDKIQFPRVIAEAEAAGAFTPDVMEKMAEGMDLMVCDVVDLIDRAQNVWDKQKEQLKKTYKQRCIRKCRKIQRRKKRT